MDKFAEEMIKLTDKEFLKKYGDTELDFVSSYKYSFGYETVINDVMVDVIVHASYGGDRDDIYREEFKSRRKLNSECLSGITLYVKDEKTGKNEEIKYYSFDYW